MIHQTKRVEEICKSWELLVAASCESLGVVASYLSPTFVTIVFLLPANYSIFRWSRTLSCTQTTHISLFLTHIFSGCPYFMDRESMNQGRVDHGSQSFGVNGNSGSNGNVTNRECT